MPAERVSMRRVREILRLKFECDRSDRPIAVAVSVARSTVKLCLILGEATGVLDAVTEGGSGAQKALMAGPDDIHHCVSPMWRSRRRGCTLEAGLHGQHRGDHDA
jgi:hypothetical protein